MDLILIRIAFVLILSAVCGLLQPFGLTHPIAALAGGLAAGMVIVFELRVRALSLRRLVGAVTGSILGIFGAYLFSLVLRNSLPDGPVESVLQIFVLLLMSYVGLVVGTSKGDMLNLEGLGNLFHQEKPGRQEMKILDTSAIIDGRIADVAETGFLEGVFVVPGFVLHELQLVADSTDPSKRQRGRRGLDVLQRMQSGLAAGRTRMQIQIVEEDYPGVREVDLKLLEMAKCHDAPIVTNDFNLNKVAQLHHVQVLNINDLVNALRPVFLPGERMSIFILKEGKEHNQGVGYLDDGTMVVVDNAREQIGRTVDISVTSVLQTTSGKMIFGKMEEASQRGEVSPSRGETHNDGRGDSLRPTAIAGNVREISS